MKRRGSLVHLSNLFSQLSAMRLECLNKVLLPPRKGKIWFTFKMHQVFLLGKDFFLFEKLLKGEKNQSFNFL